MSNHWIKKQESNLVGEHSPAVGLIWIDCDFVLDFSAIQKTRHDLMARISADMLDRLKFIDHNFMGSKNARI